MKKVTFLFILFSILFFTGRILIILEINQPWWTRNFLNDFLCMPLTLFLCLRSIQLLKKDKSIRISLFSALSLATYYALYFEIILPRFMERYTADVYDVLLYFAGAILFYFLQEPNSRESSVVKK